MPRGQPFQVRDDDPTMQQIAATVKARGVRQPGLVRPDPEGGYEIIRCFVCVGINGMTDAHGHMEFHLGSRSRDLYAQAPRIYHGILSGEYDNGQ